MQKISISRQRYYRAAYLLSILLGLVFATSDIFSQYYEFSLVQRRRFDQIHVEIWAKSLVENAPKIGGATLALQYNSQFLSPASEQDRAQTDTISDNLDQVNPIIPISSQFNLSANGFDPMQSQSYAPGYFALELKQKVLGAGGYIPSKNGKGSFIGKLIFNIIGAPSDNSLTQIDFSRNILPGDLRIFDYQGSDIESSCVFDTTSAFTVLGVSILSPATNGQVVDRDFDYQSLGADYAGGGYPIYFERSINPALYTSPIDEDLAYLFEYSLDDGKTWNSIGRAAESGTSASGAGANPKLKSGEIFASPKGSSYLISSQTGAKLDATTFRGPARVIWAKNGFFTERSEKARIRITKLAGYSNIDILSRAKDNAYAVSPASFALGRLFFLQLNGVDQYVKSPDNISNSTQLTVEAWVNLNEYKPYGSESGIVASSAGSEATSTSGSTEGAWMLYLKDGRIPAFRAREIQARGDSGYIGILTANYLDSLNAVSAASPLSSAHGKNWKHIAATVNNNVMTLYIDGELVDKIVNNKATDIRMLTTTHPIWVGVNPNGTVDQTDYLKAGIKGVRVWRIALSQDEIRQRIAGINDPSNTSVYGDLKRGLQLYYNFEGSLSDLASDPTYQFGAENGQFYLSGVNSAQNASFRPDQPHIRITSPSYGVGVSNRDGSTFDLRWVSYGIGNIAKSGTKDLDVEYSIDGGANWFLARDVNGKTLGGANGIVDAETGANVWALRNDAPSPAIKTINPFAHETLLRIKGSESNNQSDLFDVAGPFTMAPSFSIARTENSIIMIPANSTMNFSGTTAFMEAWIRPYRFPTEKEGYFPILSKIDSSSNKFHYELQLLPDGKLRFNLMDAKDSVRSATSSLSLVRPNSISMDSVWTHIGVYVFLNNGIAQSEIRFYIDGTPDRDTAVVKSLGAALSVKPANEFPLYIGYLPSKSSKTSGTINIEGSQTQNISFFGNIDTAIPNDTTVLGSATIYDKFGAAHTLAINFTKLSVPKKFSYSYSIDGTTIPWTSSLIKIDGNLDASAVTGSQFTAAAKFYDSAAVAKEFTLIFTKSSTNGEYNLNIKYGANSLYSSTVLFNNDGSLKSPFEIKLSAFDVNTAAGTYLLDTTKPHDITIQLATYDDMTTALTNYAQTTNVNFIDDRRFIYFNQDGSLKEPKSLTIGAFELNQALKLEKFDSKSPKDITVKLSDQLSGSSLKYTRSPQNIASFGQDGIASKSVQGSIVTVADSARGFLGELRELRFWNGTPNNSSPTAATEPTPMTLFIQGSQAIRANDLLNNSNVNLHSVYNFNGGSFIMNGLSRSAGQNINTAATARFYGAPISYKAVSPYIKLVEPTFKQKIANTANDVRIRWVGFDYDRDAYYTGAPNKAPSIEFSIRGGGGQLIQPYQYVGSDYWKGNSKDALSFPTGTKYKFNGTGSDIIFACNLDATIADPDEKDDGTMKQAPLSASLTNARFRLTGQYTNFAQTNVIQSEGPLFSITPASNFTVRAVLEGHHDGAVGGKLMNNIASTYNQGGIRIKLYKDIGAVGDLTATQESASGYDILDPVQKNAGANRFANINFVFTELTDGDYWVKVEHINHLPIMSRYPATFKYTGDDRNTWRIESGWDFTSWNGIDDNVLQSPSADPTALGYFTAYGYAKKTVSDINYSTCGLIYNDGRSGGTTKPLAAMVGGDVNQDLQINAADRVKVRQDDGTGLIQSDVTGDGYVNADDRTIVDRNFGKVASVYNVKFSDDPVKSSSFAPLDPINYISDTDPNLSKYFVDNAKISANNSAKKSINKNEDLQAGLSYIVTGEPILKDDKVELRFYIQNQGGDFGLANCTFAVNYNSSVLEYTNVAGEDSSIFSKKPLIGYSALRGAPTNGASDAIPELRTLEIDYDAFANLGGTAVPREKTYLGSLIFKLKNKNSAITFKWHPSVSVHTTEGRIATPEGTFMPINPLLLYSAGLTNPNGGEKLSQNKNQNVTWNTNGDAQIFVEFSEDKGVTWTKLNETPINVSEKTLAWKTPDHSSTYCLMRLIDAATEYEIDRSDATFSIMPTFAQIVRPSSGDAVYTGGKSDQIKWSAQGLDDVRFEFSSDGGLTWTSASSSVSASKSTSAWQIPKVCTKTAVIRLIDISTQKEIARSSYFKILTGSVAFKSPSAGEKLIVGKDGRIRWSSSDATLADLELSSDGGLHWTNLVSNADLTIGYKNWVIPNTVSDNCIVRAIWNADPEMEYARTGIFKIASSSGVDDFAPMGLDISSPAPNPIINRFYLNVRAMNPISLNFELYNTNGEKLINFSTKNIDSGDNKLDFGEFDLPAGAYLLKISGDGCMAYRTIIIQK
jgi:hypothetical protein